jgi:hypothetical protein
MAFPPVQIGAVRPFLLGLGTDAAVNRRWLAQRYDRLAGR